MGTIQEQRRSDQEIGMPFFLKIKKRRNYIMMKKVVVVIKPEKLTDVKHILEAHKVSGLMISNIMGHGNQKGFTQKYRGNELNSNLLPKIKVESVMPEEVVEKVTKDIVNTVRTGEFGDGKIFISPVEEAIRIRTGETGKDAL